VRSVDDLPRVLHEAFRIATTGRPGPVVIDIPKDVQFASGLYEGPAQAAPIHDYHPRTQPSPRAIAEAAALIAGAKRPLFYTGGGVINAGPAASEALRKLAAMTGAPVTSTLMGLGAFPAADPAWLGMVGMHGTFEANHAMHDCDVMIAVGARFDDRVTGRLDAFSPASKKIHIDIDPSSIGKVVRADLAILGDAGATLEALIEALKDHAQTRNRDTLEPWWRQIAAWRGRNCLNYRPSSTLIKPQLAIQRLAALTQDRDVYITTEVGQHQMWAAQYFPFQKPNRWMTSGGLGTMGYGLPAAVGVQVAHPNALVIDIAGDASVQMTMQEMATAIQYELPIKIFILNNEWMGMVRQWQQLLHGERYSHSYSASLPDFVKLAEAYGAVGLRVEDPANLDDVIEEMIDTPRPVIVDCRVERNENCFPMIPSGKAHNEMLLADDQGDLSEAIDAAGKGLV
jgi:acetolactate synthase-1/2/3 large subunit